MEKNLINEKVTKIFREILDDETLNLRADTTAQDIEEWDSLTHISIITAIQDEFSIQFDMDDVFALKNIGEMLDAIEKLIQ